MASKIWISNTTFARTVIERRVWPGNRESTNSPPCYPDSVATEGLVAKLADAQDLGSGGRRAMGVRPSPFAPCLFAAHYRSLRMICYHLGA
jgi:hypothetical protein